MATFGNILARRGGVAQTGLEVEFTLALPGADRNGPRLTETVTALLLPVSITARARALRAADDYVARAEAEAQKARVEAEARDEVAAPCEAPSYDEERAFRFIVEAMRCPQDARKHFVANVDLDKFRESLIVDQINHISVQYNLLIQREYAELRPQDAKKMREDARQSFTGTPA